MHNITGPPSATLSTGKQVQFVVGAGIKESHPKDRHPSAHNITDDHHNMSTVNPVIYILLLVNSLAFLRLF